MRIASIRAYVESRIPARLRRTLSADDVLQEVWLAATLATEDTGPRSPRAIDSWLRTIADHKMIDALRAVRTRKRGGDRVFALDPQVRLSSMCEIFDKLRPTKNTPSRDVGRAEAAHAVGIAIAALPEDRRRVIELLYIAGVSREEAAKRMGRSLASVNSLVFNALRQLRTMLGEMSKYLSA